MPDDVDGFVSRAQDNTLSTRFAIFGLSYGFSDWFALISGFVFLSGADCFNFKNYSCDISRWLMNLDVGL